MMIMSHCGISVVINVRLFDSQDELKTGDRKKTCPDTSSDYELLCTPDRNHEKYMNGGNTGVFKRIVYAALHTYMKTAAQPVFI